MHIHMHRCIYIYRMCIKQNSEKTPDFSQHSSFAASRPMNMQTKPRQMTFGQV